MIKIKEEAECKLKTFNARKDELFMKKTTGVKILLHLVLLCVTLLAFCSTSFAEKLDPRWKWSYEDTGLNFYLDTKTIKYDAATQNTKVWILTLGNNGTYRILSHHLISFKDKTDQILQWIKYSGNVVESSSKKSNSCIRIVRPDSLLEAVAQNAASQLGITPLYTGGQDRWQWLHSIDTYNLYIAKDTLLFHPDTGKYSIWAKKKYLDGNEYFALVFLSFADGTVKSLWTGDDYLPPMPGSKEEYILNAAKNIR